MPKKRRCSSQKLTHLGAVLLLCASLSLSLAVASATPQCESRLLPPELKVSIDIGSPENRARSIKKLEIATRFAANRNGRAHSDAIVVGGVNAQVLDGGLELVETWIGWYEKNTRYLRQYNRLAQQFSGEGYLELGFEDTYGRRDAGWIYSRFFSPLQRYFSVALLSYVPIVGIFERSQSLSVVDLGAGVGDTTYAISRLFPKSSIVAVDKSESLLSAFHENWRTIERVKADLEVDALPFGDATKDMVVSFYCVSQYLSMQGFNHALAEARRVLKNNGLLVLDFGHSVDKGAGSVGRGIDRFKADIEAQGFEVTDVGPAIQWKIENSSGARDAPEERNHSEYSVVIAQKRGGLKNSP